MTATVDFTPIALPTLPQYVKVSVHVKFLQLHNPQQVRQENQVKQDIIVADHTATVKVVAWEKHVNSLEVGKSYSSKHFYVKDKKASLMPKSDFEITLIERAVSPPPNDDDEYYGAPLVNFVRYLYICHVIYKSAIYHN